MTADTTHLLGLLLGTEDDWPRAFESLVRKLGTVTDADGRTHAFDSERVTIEPFDLRDNPRQGLVIDRLAYWYHHPREWLKKVALSNDVYLLNSPFTFQAMEKHAAYCAMMRLGLKVPPTVLVPPKEPVDHGKYAYTAERYNRPFDLDAIADRIGYPMFMKPYDGGGWKGVNKIDDPAALRARYEESGKLVMHLQQAVTPFDRFVRCIGLGPQTRIVRYDPGAALHDRYTMAKNFVTADEAALLRDTTLTINAFFGWDFNSCESLHKDGVWYPIDFANPCPDSQVTSLHYHFPWLVMANIRWSVFCAVTRRPMRRTLDWEPFYAIAAEKEMPYRERLRAYARVAEERLDSARFEEFCARHLAHLDEIAFEFFATPIARDAVRKKVAALFPPHEVEQFTELFWNRIQAWRADAQAEARGARSA